MKGISFARLVVGMLNPSPAPWRRVETPNNRQSCCLHPALGPPCIHRDCGVFRGFEYCLALLSALEEEFLGGSSPCGKGRMFASGDAKGRSTQTHTHSHTHIHKSHTVQALSLWCTHKHWNILTCENTCIHTHAQTHIVTLLQSACTLPHTFSLTHVHTRVQVDHAHTHTHMHIHAHGWTHTNTETSAHSWITQRHTETFAHSFTQTHTHTRQELMAWSTGSVPGSAVSWFAVFPWWKQK